MDLGRTRLLEKKGGRTRVGTVCLVRVGRWPCPHSLAGPVSSRVAVVGGEGAAPHRALEALFTCSRFFPALTSCEPGTGARLALRVPLWALCTVVKCVAWGWEGLGSVLAVGPCLRGFTPP